MTPIGTLTRIYYSILALGFTATLKAAIIYLLSYNPAKDRSFDKRHKTDTTSVVEQDHLGISDEKTRRAALLYVSAPEKLERYILGHLKIDYENFDFVDMGCGKGRVLMIASDLPFRTVTGVEISQELCLIAEKNLQIYRSSRRRCSQIQVQCMDARLFDIKNENTVFHFYHPFNADILRPILGAIVSRFSGSSKHVRIVYMWAQLPEIFPLFDELRFRRVEYVKPLNARYQYAVFTL